jgi:serine-type D-Ala-D-Ala carboxypeptidase/endopeptidase (penicillin-binding protein 4)
MLATSDNHIAELLTRLIGRQAEGAGTTGAGVKAVVAEAATLGIPTAGVHMVDGSGLSPQNRSTCAELLAAYRLGAQPRFAGLWSGLPVAGRSGTLYRQWAGTPLSGRVVAKTGWIDGVAAIVGTVAGPKPVQFVLAMNGSFNYAQAEARQYQALDALLAYSQS